MSTGAGDHTSYFHTFKLRLVLRIHNIEIGACRFLLRPPELVNKWVGELFTCLHSVPSSSNVILILLVIGKVSRITNQRDVVRVANLLLLLKLVTAILRRKELIDVPKSFELITQKRRRMNTPHIWWGRFPILIHVEAWLRARRTSHNNTARLAMGKEAVDSMELATALFHGDCFPDTDNTKEL